MSLINLGNTIPTDYIRRYLFDGDGNSTTGTNNSTVTNGTWVKSERMYQNQCLSWGATTTCTYASVTYTNSYIWIYASGVWTLTKNSAKVTATALNGVNGEYYAMLTFFNRTLTTEEEQILKLEGLRKLGPSNIASYPKLFDGLVGYFENPTGNELWNIATGVKSTYVGGTNTTDNLGINKAIINPNYTWSSITYTTGYTFENSGSGWQIVTSPTGLSATGINRTTTLRNIFLFSRTLSADEVTTLQTLCNSDYIYPTPSYDLPNLRNGLVLDLNEQGQDLSGNGNNGILYNNPTITRQGKAKGLTYNGNGQYIITSLTSSSLGLGANKTMFAWIYCDGANTANGEQRVMYFGNFNFATPNFHWNGFAINSGLNTLTMGDYDGTDRPLTTSFSTGKWFFVTGVYNRDTNTKILYINGVQVGTNTFGNPSGINAVLSIARSNSTNSDFGYFKGKCINPRVRNRALSSKEIEQLYYSQKGSFIY